MWAGFSLIVKGVFVVLEDVRIEDCKAFRGVYWGIFGGLLF